MIGFPSVAAVRISVRKFLIVQIYSSMFLLVVNELLGQYTVSGQVSLCGCTYLIGHQQMRQIKRRQSTITASRIKRFKHHQISRLIFHRFSFGCRLVVYRQLQQRRLCRA